MSSHERDPGRVKVLLVFADEIYARGLQAALAPLHEFDDIRTASGVEKALTATAHRSTDVVLLDCELPGAVGFAQHLGTSSAARLLLCARPCWSERLTGFAPFAAGILTAARPTPEMVTVAVSAINTGHAVVGIDFLRVLCGSSRRSRRSTPGTASDGEFLNESERAVISLMAEGVSSRDIAQRLECSERTVKTILHRVLTKLGARNRTHAVALAVRDNLL
jgi:DNA-binding NarL/FixJ family response regulator